MLNKFLGLAVAGAIVVLAPMPLQASGSGGGGGGFGSGSGSFSTPSGPSDPFAGAYSRGKSHFKKRITCKTCAFPDGVHDGVTAGKVVKRIRSGEFQLNEKQRSDLMVFLQRRYGVTA